MKTKILMLDTRCRLLALNLTLDYAKDPNPENWRTISGAHVHLTNGKIDGGAGGSFNGKVYIGKRNKIPLEQQGGYRRREIEKIKPALSFYQGSAHVTSETVAAWKEKPYAGWLQEYENNLKEMSKNWIRKSTYWQPKNKNGEKVYGHPIGIFSKNRQELIREAISELQRQQQGELPKLTGKSEKQENFALRNRTAVLGRLASIVGEDNPALPAIKQAIAAKSQDASFWIDNNAVLMWADWQEWAAEGKSPQEIADRMTWFTKAEGAKKRPFEKGDTVLKEQIPKWAIYDKLDNTQKEAYGTCYFYRVFKETPKAVYLSGTGDFAGEFDIDVSFWCPRSILGEKIEDEEMETLKYKPDTWLYMYGEKWDGD